MGIRHCYQEKQRIKKCIINEQNENKNINKNVNDDLVPNEAYIFQIYLSDHLLYHTHL